jgi:hypothetical protein
MPWDEAIESNLTQALMRGTAWLLSASSARRLTALCVTRSCCEMVDQEFQRLDSDPSITIHVHASTLPLGEPSFFAHGNTFVRFPSRAALRRWLALHPRGVAFTWEDSGWIDFEEVWLGDERTRLFQEMRSFVDTHGMTLERRR